MRSIIITLAVIIVGSFTTISSADAINVKHHLDKQTEYVQNLNVESRKLNRLLVQTQQTKQKTQVDVQQLEQQTQTAASERQTLEAQLGAN